MAAQNISVYGIYFDAQGRVLLVKDAHSLLWGFPGGGVEKDEMHEDAVRREFLEETNLQVHGELTFVAQQQSPTKQRYFYRVKQIEGRISASGNNDDVLNVAYFDVNHLPFDTLASGVERIIYHLK